MKLPRTQKQLEKFAAAHLGRTFRLIGRRTPFRAVHFALVGGFIPAVTGHSLDGKFQTQPRLADITWEE